MRLGLRLSVAIFLALNAIALSDACAQGRVKWRYRSAASYFPVRPALAKDGTVYAVDVQGTLHAIRPNGVRLWTLPAAGRAGVSVGTDGTVYAGDTTQILAVRPTGSVKWRYRIAPAAHDMYGPTVGPDGNIYANAASGPGVLSLSPAGKLRWATASRATRPWVQNQELVFRPASGNRGLQVIFSGNAKLAQIDTADGKMTVVSHGGNQQPAIGPNGDLYSTSSMELRAFRADATQRWSIRAPRSIGMSDPTVGSDGVLYAIIDNELHALRASDGSSIWRHGDGSTLRTATASPTNTMILLIGRTRGRTDFARAIDPSGSTMWQVDLGFENRGDFPTTTVRFTPDGNTAYLGAQSGQTGDSHLVAIDTRPVHVAEAWVWGRACRGASTKLPTLSYTGLPRLGSTFSVDLSDAQPSAPVLHVIGLNPMRFRFDGLGAPNCTAYVVPDMILPLRTGTHGGVRSVLPVPNTHRLAGLKFYHQFVVADPVNRAGFIMTTGGATLLGM